MESIFRNTPPEDRSLHQDLLIRLAENLWSRFDEYHRLAAQYGQNTIRAIFIANGGAIVAILALTGSMYSNNNHVASHVAMLLRGPSIVFSVGIFLSVVASGIGYFNYRWASENVQNQMDVINLCLRNRSMDNWGREPTQRWINPTSYIAAAAIVLSMGCFIWGALWAGLAISESSDEAGQKADQCASTFELDGQQIHLVFCTKQVNENKGD